MYIRCLICNYSAFIELLPQDDDDVDSDVNKDCTHKDQDKDKDQSHKDKDKDLTYKDSKQKEDKHITGFLKLYH